MVNFLDFDGTDPAIAALEAAESLTAAKLAFEASGLKRFAFGATSVGEMDARLDIREVNQGLTRIATDHGVEPAAILAVLRREFISDKDPCGGCPAGTKCKCTHDGCRCVKTSATKDSYPSTGQTRDDEDDTLGSCGCRDYHAADCPLRTRESDYYDADLRDMDEPDDWRAYSSKTAMKAPDADQLEGAGSLVGVDGNAFSIMGNTFKALKRAGADQEYVSSLSNHVTQGGDYDHLLGHCMEALDGDWDPEHKHGTKESAKEVVHLKDKDVTIEKGKLTREVGGKPSEHLDKVHELADKGDKAALFYLNVLKH